MTATIPTDRVRGAARGAATDADAEGGAANRDPTIAFDSGSCISSVRTKAVADMTSVAGRCNLGSSSGGRGCGGGCAYSGDFKGGGGDFEGGGGECKGGGGGDGGGAGDIGPTAFLLATIRTADAGGIVTTILPDLGAIDSGEEGTMCCASNRYTLTSSDWYRTSSSGIGTSTLTSPSYCRQINSTCTRWPSEDRKPCAPT
mmetsp:Transcript_73021/g.176196  ORF Transcript_73021/g.176196 Transcript_73021/m.176196 type:complete len:201 (+) Transcript_73021:760-1362(+)